MADQGFIHEWPGWETVRVIGHGSFGTVYEIRREAYGLTETAALKVVAIPHDSSALEELRDSCGSEESITANIESQVEGILREYSTMRKLNGVTNIVSCDDFRVVQHDDDPGRDIYIKMELLTPLTKAIGLLPSDEQVVRVAKDMCRALSLCRKHSIIHRDIKPANIFISENGDYKLGDFGIAKAIEQASRGTKAGTYQYMAPEVYSNQPYDFRADIYSLGLVLHWLLNERRAPFLPLPPAVVTADREERARKLRFDGTAIPAPSHGSEELKRIVLKACAFDQTLRYQSADEMLRDLEELQSSSGERIDDLPSGGRPSEEEASIREGTPGDESGGTLGGFGRNAGTGKNEKNREIPRYVWIGLIAAALVLVLFAWPRLKDMLTSTRPIETPAPATETPAPTPHVHEWGAWLVETAASCEKPGVEVRTCNLDQSHQERRELPATGHDWMNAADGTQVCTRCGERRGEPLPTPHVHEWGGWLVETAASCERTGVEVRTCILDRSHQERRQIPATGHSWLSASFTRPKTCSRCGATSGSPAPESCFPTIEEVEYLYANGSQRYASSKTGARLTLPGRSSYLAQPYRTKIRSSHVGGRIYIMPLSKEGNGDLGTIDDGTEVVIVAREGDCLFFVTYDGTMGWNGTQYFGEH